MMNEERRHVELEELKAVQMQALTNWYDGFGTGDIEHAYSGFEEDVTWSGVGPDLARRVYRGKRAIINYQSTWVHQVWDGKMVYEPVFQLGDGNVILAYWKDYAVNRDTGVKYTNIGGFVFEFDGKPLVQRALTWFDTGPLVGRPQEVFSDADVPAEL
jgi:ketosteroid isomerase-like protein